MPNNAPPKTQANTIAAVVNVLMGYEPTNQAHQRKLNPTTGPCRIKSRLFLLALLSLV